jgi:hypothetical protein
MEHTVEPERSYHHSVYMGSYYGDESGLIFTMTDLSTVKFRLPSWHEDPI